MLEKTEKHLIKRLERLEKENRSLHRDLREAVRDKNEARADAAMFKERLESPIFEAMREEWFKSGFDAKAHVLREGEVLGKDEWAEGAIYGFRKPDGMTESAYKQAFKEEFGIRILMAYRDMRREDRVG